MSNYQAARESALQKKYNRAELQRAVMNGIPEFTDKDLEFLCRNLSSVTETVRIAIRGILPGEIVEDIFDLPDAKFNKPS